MSIEKEFYEEVLPYSRDTWKIKRFNRALDKILDSDNLEKSFETCRISRYDHPEMPSIKDVPKYFLILGGLATTAEVFVHVFS